MLLGSANPNDGFAMAMVVILVMSLSMVALLIATIFRSSKQMPSAVDELLEELDRDEKASRISVSQATGEAWERPTDWWK